MHNDDFSSSRRRLVQGASVGLAATLAAPAWTRAASAAAGGVPPMFDPTKRYPKPPFDAQPQPWPGLAARMHPKPDHGEQSYQGHARLSGRKALITGGDSGIGRAAAIAFAREGADVAINYLPAEEEDAREVIALVRAAGRKGVPLPGDIRDEGFCRSLVDKAVAGLGGLDILVNNAGRQQSHDSIDELTTELFDWTLKTNLYAMFWITKAALAHMPPGAAIINTASVEAYSPDQNLLDYATTKAGIVAFTKSLAKQVISKGIRVNAVAPGPFWTPLQISGGQTEDKVKKFGANTPMERPGQPAEIAHIYVDLASSEASYVTGQVFGASGGKGEP
jgi:NAD(P)-dependent dehydrogenase (short-subunit alcohol dehydrogenase family)